MQLLETDKPIVRDAIIADYERRTKLVRGFSQSRHANMLDINPAVHSRVMNGHTDKVLGEGEWIRLAKMLGTPLNAVEWKIAETVTFNHITTQLSLCEERSLSGMFCDEKGLGKTTAALWQWRNRVNVAVVDCSQVRNRTMLIRAIAKAFGCEWRGKLEDVRQAMINSIMALDKPLLILDEFGDLNDAVMLELKGLWNALEDMMGWYVMGATGLEKKIDGKITNKKVGFEEIFDRLGGRYQSVIKNEAEAVQAQIKRSQAMQILKLNLPGLPAAEAKEMLNSTSLNLRRLKTDIIKRKTLQIA